MLPPPGARPVLPQLHNRTRIVNPYCDQLTAERDTRPLARDQFTEAVEDLCSAVGLATESDDDIILVRYILHHAPTKNPVAAAQALNLAFASCMPHISLKLHAVHLGRDAYFDHPKYGSLPEGNWQTQGETLFDAARPPPLKGNGKGAQKKAPKPYNDEISLTALGEAVEAISLLCDISPEDFFAETRGSYSSEFHASDAILRAAIQIRTRRNAKDAYIFLQKYLNTVAAFEAGANLFNQYHSKVKESTSTGSHRKVGLKAGKWALKVNAWVASGKDAVRKAFPSVSEIYLRTLVYMPCPAQAKEPERRLFLTTLRAEAEAAGYPRPYAINKAVYRTFDQHAGNTYGRTLVAPEKEAVLWHVGQTGYKTSMTTAAIAASDEVCITYRKVMTLLGSYEDLDSAIEAVLAKFPTDAPAVPGPAEIYALQVAEKAENAKAKAQAKASGSGTTASSPSSSASLPTTKASGSAKADGTIKAKTVKRSAEVSSSSKSKKARR